MSRIYECCIVGILSLADDTALFQEKCTKLADAKAELFVHTEQSDLLIRAAFRFRREIKIIT